MGVGDAKQDSKVLEAATEQLATIAGQQPSVRRARKSIAAFKLREGMPVGVAVTLRRERAYEFLDRLISIAIPRIRDFRGLNPRSFDGRGNYSMGVREQIIFPEIDYDAIDQVRGLDITITTSAASDVEAFALLEALGMPFAPQGAPPASTRRPTMPRPRRTRRRGGASAEAPAPAARDQAAADEALTPSRPRRRGRGSEPTEAAASAEPPRPRRRQARAEAASEPGGDSADAEPGHRERRAPGRAGPEPERAGERRGPTRRRAAD